MGARCSVSLVIVFLFLATAAAVIAFFVNEWGTLALRKTNYGLWKKCGGLANLGGSDSCNWLYGDSDRLFDTRNWGEIPNWFMACQIMFTIAVGTLVLNLCVLLPFYSCTCTKGGACFRCIGVMIYSSLLFTALVMGVALLVFGLELYLNEDAQSLRGVTMNRDLGWAFWLMVGSWGLTVLTVASMFVAHRRVVVG